MHARVARGYDVVAFCPNWQCDSYARWFRTFGLWDYCSELVPREQLGELTVEIEGGPGARLTVHNLHEVLRWL